jgi:transcriptional regulator with XRE-family HTH domain
MEHKGATEASSGRLDLDGMSAAVGHRIRTARQLRGMSMSELARLSNVAKGTLSQLELGRGNPTLGTILAIASTLEVSVGNLITGAARPETQVVRAGEGTELREGPVTARLLGRSSGDSDRFEIYDLEIASTGRRLSPGYEETVFEYIFVREGTLVVGPESAPICLESGDYASYQADSSHVYEAIGDVARAICVVRHPPLALEPRSAPFGSGRSNGWSSPRRRTARSTDDTDAAN